jgi:DNA-binding ferritin-like protein
MSHERLEDDLSAVADRLDDVAERLADLAMSALRAELDNADSDGKRPEIEKRISKARRGVERAAQQLRGGPSSTLI